MHKIWNAEVRELPGLFSPRWSGNGQTQRCLVDLLHLPRHDCWPYCPAKSSSHLPVLGCHSTIASQRPLALCNCSFWGMLGESSSHGGSRVLTWQAPVQKDLTSLSLYHFAGIPLAQGTITKLRVSVRRGHKEAFYICCNYKWGILHLL